MCYVIDSNKTFEQAATNQKAAVKHHAFGVLHIHDLGNTLRSKGIAFSENCKVFEVCNPGQAGKVLSTDMRLNMALPCRISVYTEKVKTRVGMISPVPILPALSQDQALVNVAQKVELKARKMIDESK